MKKLSLVIISVLVIVLISFQQKYKSLQKEILAVSDSLSTLKEQNFRQRRLNSNRNVDLIFEKTYVKVTLGSNEEHQIIANYGQLFFSARYRLMGDSSVLATIVRYSEKNPITGVGIDTIYAVKTQKLDYSVLRVFKEKLSKIDFLDAVREYNITCCFGGGGIALQSILSPTKTIQFSTFCRASTQFAEACEYLMRQANEEELNRILAAQDKAIKELEKK